MTIELVAATIASLAKQSTAVLPAERVVEHGGEAPLHRGAALECGRAGGVDLDQEQARQGGSGGECVEVRAQTAVEALERRPARGRVAKACARTTSVAASSALMKQSSLESNCS